MSYVIVREIYDRLLDLEKSDWNTYYKKTFDEILQMYSKGGNQKQETATKTYPFLPVEELEGNYSHQAFGNVEIILKDGRLIFKSESGLTSELQHVNFNVFKGSTTDFYLPTINFLKNCRIFKIILLSF